ncbi:centrosomal protein [Achlya hypogyna]|uniref:Centrosomal protein of 76 kDa n=1 Tax=Achlya hypogyna TaxID=1202772 RepID=A0A1V9ZPL7_ACHHY|nr:centrosomal protein [Achlya hypogyna]
MEAMTIDKLASLRALIDAKLRDEGVYAQLRSLIQATTSPEAPDAVVAGVLESEVVQQLIASVKANPPLDEPATASPSCAPVSESSVTLQLRLLGGRAFVDCLSAPPATSTHRHCFVVDVAFLHHRFRSVPAVCSVEPAFDDTFHIPLPTPPPTSRAVEVLPKWEALCRMRDPIQITLLKVVQKQTPGGGWATGAVEFVAGARLDWRRVLSCTHATAHFPLQLEGPLKVSLGVLDVRLDVLGFRKSAAIATDVATLLQKEILTTNAVHTQFYQYAKQWWEELTLETPTAKTRAFKIFTEDETHRYRMVCTYLVPLQCRCISTPSEAARVVSLIPFVRAVALGGGGRQDGWKSLPAFLALGQGDCEEHALLLTSLLLGFGLDAYVVTGAVRPKGANAGVPHAWVLVKEKAGVVLWEAVTGVRYRLADGHPYERIDCVFNHCEFFANRQSGPVRELHLDLHEPKHWKRMETALLDQLPRQSPVALVPPAPDTDGALETALQAALTDLRGGWGYATAWTPALSHYLRPALTSYELERTYGIGNLENDHFEMSIKRYVPEGATFQGCPVFLSAAPELTVDALVLKLRRDPTATAILQTHTRAAQFGLAVREYRYPERITGAWVMLGVVYRPES